MSWGKMDPNSDHQLWSHWTFTVYGGKSVPIKEVQENVARWLKMGFGSVGQIAEKLAQTIQVPGTATFCE